MKLTQEIVRELLYYAPSTGKLFWWPRERHWFKSDRHFNTWNTRFAGMEAFTAFDEKAGYLLGGILGKTYRAHRIIWLYQTGEWPEEQIDHINHDRKDNRWLNLRQVSNEENHRNISQQRNNRSGYTGVSWDKRCSKWYARIMVDNKKIELGYFDLMEDAVEARREAEIKYGFHENHGR